MLGLAVGSLNIRGSAQTGLTVLINVIHGRRWKFMSDGMKLKYTKIVYETWSLTHFI
jgi:hypothetical protein